MARGNVAPLPFVLDQHVDHAVGVLHVRSGQSARANTPRPPPSIMAGPPMPMLLAAVAMMASQQPSSAALPAKQRPPRCRPPAPGPTARRGGEGVPHAGPRPRGVGVAGPPAAAAANSTTGSCWSSACPGPACGRSWRGCARPGAGQHGGVVGHDHGARFLFAALRAVDGADARHHAVGRGVGDEVVHAAARLRGHGKLAVFDEEPRRAGSAMFSRAVRWPCAWRRATAAGRFASSVKAWRSMTRCRSGRMWSGPAPRPAGGFWRASSPRVQHQHLALGHEGPGAARGPPRPGVRREMRAPSSWLRARPVLRPPPPRRPRPRRTAPGARAWGARGMRVGRPRRALLVLNDFWPRSAYL